MNNDNDFDLLIDVVFDMNPQIGVLGTKYQDLVISFCLGEEESIPQFHLIYLHIRSEILLLQDKTRQINNPTDKYIRELSELKHIPRYMNPFELYYRNFERLPQIQKLSTTFPPKI